MSRQELSGALMLNDGGTLVLDPPSKDAWVADLGYGHGDTAIQRMRIVGP